MGKTMGAEVPAGIDALMKAKWKKMLDLAGEMMECQGAAIWCAEALEAEPVVRSSPPVGRPADAGQLLQNARLFCKRVIERRGELVEPNAARTVALEDRGVSAFMGFPIAWPDGQVFGVICVFDEREKQFWNWSRQLLAQYAETIGDDLAALLDREKLKAQQEGAAYGPHSGLPTEEQFGKIFRLSPAAIVIAAVEDGRIIDVNDSYLKMFGFAREELIGKTGIQLSIFDDPKVRRAIVRRLDNHEPVRDYETALLTKTGEMRQVLISVDKAEIGDRPCLISTFYDLSSIILLKQNLRAINERFLLATRAADMGIWDWYIPDGSVIWDDRMLGLYGATRQAFRGTHADWLAFVHPEDRENAERRLNKALGDNNEYFDEFRIVRPSGEVRHMRAHGNTVRDEEGRPVRITGVNFDITAAREAQVQLLESEARYRSLFHNNNAVQIILNIETGEIFDANSAACDFYGFDDMCGRKYWDIDMSGEEALRARIAVAYQRKTDYLNTLHCRGDGQQRDMEIFCGRVELAGRKLLHMIIHDVTERKRTERGLIESENRFRLFVESAPDGVFVELDGLFAYVNRMAVKLLGASSEHELLGKPVSMFFAKPSRGRITRHIHRLNVSKKDLQIVKETLEKVGGDQLEVELSAVPFHLGGEDGALFFLHDISARRQLEMEKINIEAQLRQKQKLESIGVLAGGVAHEINNPVSGIINYAQLIAESPAADPQTVEYGNEIIREGQRIAGIVKNLLKFARQEKQTHSLAQVNDIVNDTLSLIRTIISKDKIALEVALAPGLPCIKCRSQQIQQVLMNLITNARDALNARYRNDEEDKKIYLFSSMFSKENRQWVRIVVEDHGMGIPDEVKDKMFDPFFTTKSRDKGTGLGLSISHGIVSDHHGALYFESEWGQGARAVLELPVDNGWELMAGAEG